MQTINITPTSSELDDSKPKLILIKGIAIATIIVSLIGGIIYVGNTGKAITKADPKEQIKTGDGHRELTTQTKPSEGNIDKGEKHQITTPQTQPSGQSQIIVKKQQKPIVIEEGSQAWFCIQNNGGSGCLDRDRFAPNFKVIAPPRPQKTYEDYLVQYGVKGGDCGRYLNGQPNCF